MVDAGLGQWLKEGVLWTPAEDAAVAAKFGTLAVVTQVVTPLATKAAADAEGARQIVFLGGAPFVVDAVTVGGLRADLIGQPVTIQGDRLGYEASPVIFVLGYEESSTTDETTLIGLRKLL